jgi:anaerobic magnesium-protoporphyrin IX monomethyl ester cyclase
MDSMVSTETSAVEVCLVRPPTVTTVGAVGQDAVPPLGLAYLAGSLRAAGHQVTAVDAVGEAVHQYTRIQGAGGRVLQHGLKADEIVARISPTARVIGVSCMFSVDWLSSRVVVNRIRSKFPEALIILGGEHVTALPDYVMEDCPAADVLVLGEGEETLLDLVDAYRGGRDLGQVPGIYYRKDGQTLKTGRRPRIRSVDQIPEPDWSVVPIHHYIDNALTHGANLGRCMPILASRGCPYSCTFCSNPQMWGTLWKARSPRAVVDEIKKYMAQYGATNFDFYDLTAIVKRDWIIEFCQLLIEEDLKITWQLPSGTRSEAIDFEVASYLFRSGCRIINYAPESGSAAELQRIKKRVKTDRMLDSMRDAHKAGLQMKVNFIFGLPQATWKDVFATFRFITSLAVIGADDIGAFPFSPYPGSELFERLRAAGRLRLDEEYFHNLLAYTDPENSVSYGEHFSSRTLSAVNMIAMYYFYALSFLFRPTRLAKLVRRLLTRDTSTKLMMALSHRRRKKAAVLLAEKSNQDTVIIEPIYRPRTVS